MKADQIKPQVELLLNILSEQLKIYKELLELAQRERSALTASKIEDFNTVTSEKNYLVEMLNRIEHRRITLMNEIAGKLKIDPNKLAIVALADQVDGVTGKKLFGLRANLRSVIANLQKENEINKNLMSHCIKLMDNSLSLLKSVLCCEPTYVNTGHFVTVEDSGVLFQSKV
jgi:flagellar biosynthesis/type III secretory pathway chaperone